MNFKTLFRKLTIERFRKLVFQKMFLNCPIDVKLGRKTEKCYVRVTVNTEKEGCMSYTTPEDAQRPRTVYDIHPDFRGI